MCVVCFCFKVQLKRCKPKKRPSLTGIIVTLGTSGRRYRSFASPFAASFPSISLTAALPSSVKAFNALPTSSSLAELPEEEERDDVAAIRLLLQRSESLLQSPNFMNDRGIFIDGLDSTTIAAASEHLEAPSLASNDDSWLIDPASLPKERQSRRLTSSLGLDWEVNSHRRAILQLAFCQHRLPTRSYSIERVFLSSLTC